MKRILLMDDEPVVLEVLSRMLEHAGFDVTTCTDGWQAVDAYARSRFESKPFDVVMTDLYIRDGMGGQETALELQKLDPDARVIATSGRRDHPVMLDHRAFGFSAAIEKPYKMKRLQEVILGVLREAKAPV